jgi:hypothetical protein
VVRIPVAGFFKPSYEASASRYSVVADTTASGAARPPALNLRHQTELVEREGISARPDRHIGLCKAQSFQKD